MIVFSAFDRGAAVASELRATLGWKSAKTVAAKRRQVPRLVFGRVYRSE
jgi:hypothetical protein